MGLLRPATPGFLTTLTATILLAVVSFSVPYFKTVYFLLASYNTDGQSGLIKIGTLGYCLELNGNETCTSPSIGYDFNPNVLLGNNTQFQIPNVLAKWLTYALFLHVIALGLAGVSAIFGLLAHIREFSMTCFSSCVSGAAAAISLIAFIFDLVMFFLVRARVNSIDGAQAQIGMAIWLTLAAWILLFISGCMFGIGRCCIINRPRGPRGKPDQEFGAGSGQGVNTPMSGGNGRTAAPNPTAAYADQMRMDAIKAETERKARQKASVKEGGLPAFDEYERQPLTDEDELHQPPPPRTPYRDQPSPGNGGRYGAAGAATGYVPAHAIPGQQRRQPSAASGVSSNGGGRGGAAEGYNPSFPAAPSSGYGQPQYPPRQPSLSERNIYESAGLPPTTQSNLSVGGVAGYGAGGGNDYLRPGPQPHSRGDGYSHHTQASSYHSAYSHQAYPSQYNARSPDPQQAAYHHQDATAYSAYNPPGGWDQQQAQPQPSPASTYTDPYGGYASQPGSAIQSQYPPAQPSASSYAPHPQSPPMPSAQIPTFAQPQPRQPATDFSSPPQSYAQPAPINTSSSGAGAGGWRQSPTRGPRSPTSPTRLPGWREEPEPASLGPAAGRSLPALPPSDAPPEYDAGPSGSGAGGGGGDAGGWRNEKAVYRP